MFERNGDRGGYTIKTTKTGYMVEMWNKMSGDYTGLKVVVRFADAEKAGIEKDLTKKWNEVYNHGEMLFDLVINDYIDYKVLRKAEKVF